MTKPKNQEIYIQSNINLGKSDYEKLHKQGEKILIDNQNSTDDFLLKLIPLEQDGKKGVAAICPVKNDYEFISTLRCVLQTFYTLNPDLTEAIASHFFTEEVPKITASKQPKMH